MLRVLQAVTCMDRGGLETMLMNYYRHIDRTRVQFDFLTHRAREGAYDKEIYALFKQGTKQLCSSSVIYKGYGFYNLALDPGTKGSTVTLFGGNNRWVSWDCKAAKGQVKFP